MITIIPPPDVKLPNGQVVDFYAFLTNSLLIDKRFGQDLEHLFMASRIERAAKNKDKVELQDKDFDLLCEVMQKPQGGYNPQISIYLIPFLQAILDAQAKTPQSPAWPTARGTGLSRFLQ